MAAHEPVATVIAGATSTAQVRANAAATGAWPLTSAELAEVARLLGRCTPTGRDGRTLAPRRPACSWTTLARETGLRRGMQVLQHVRGPRVLVDEESLATGEPQTEAGFAAGSAAPLAQEKRHWR